MSFAVMAVLLPLLAAPLLGLFGTPIQGARANLAVTAMTFALTFIVTFAPGLGLVRADGLGIVFGILSGFVALTNAVANLHLVRRASATLTVRNWRLYHAMCQIIIGAVLLGLYSDNIGLLWFAAEAATIAGIIGVSLCGGGAARRAGVTYFVLGGAGIAFAGFGTMLIYLAAQPILGTGGALSFAALDAAAAQLPGGLLTLAFVFLLAGYGAIAAVAPLHGWLPDAGAAATPPLTGCLNLTLNLGLLALLRFSHLLHVNVAAAGGAISPAPLLLAAGAASLWLAAIRLRGEGNIRRFAGIAATGQCGLAVFAFGIGGGAAIFGALLNMICCTLINSALLQTLIHAGAWEFRQLRGLAGRDHRLAWLLGACLFALTALPPSGLFSSVFIITSQTVQRRPLLAAVLIAGLLLASISVVRRIGPLFIAPPGAARPPSPRRLAIPALHLALALLIAFAMPRHLVSVLSAAAAGLQ